MNVVFVGVQGSGKGTQAEFVARELGLCHVSVGDLFREITSGEASPLKEKLETVMNEGQLAPDDLTIEILVKRMEKPDCSGGVLFDGFPRNLSQAELLDNVVKLDKVVEIKISDEESLKRLSGRVSCVNCKAGYNVYTAPRPTTEGKCDKCGGELVRRSDDNPESIKKRIELYHEETEPILDKYRDKALVVDGEREIGEITKDILEKLA